LINRSFENYLALKITLSDRNGSKAARASFNKKVKTLLKRLSLTSLKLISIPTKGKK